jgi:hypothetical protein
MVISRSRLLNDCHQAATNLHESSSPQAAAAAAGEALTRHRRYHLLRAWLASEHMEENHVLLSWVHELTLDHSTTMYYNQTTEF